MENKVVGNGDYTQIESFLRKKNCRKFLLVCSKSYEKLKIKEYLQAVDIPSVRFSDFKPNPDYGDVIKGIKIFNENACDCIVAVGGGSAIDTAKCIKALCKSNVSADTFINEYSDTGIPFVAVPTTAGTGSESTRFSVIYFQGVKQSVTADYLLPDLAVLDASVLVSLPTYQKKCTVLDALCQAIESYWSVHSTEKSKQFAVLAIEKILQYVHTYLTNADQESCKEIMLASNYAGKAINITSTTAAHAMSYKITTECGFPHGHAVAVCLPILWRFMLKNIHKCQDARGEKYLQEVFQKLGIIMGGETSIDGVMVFEELLKKLEMSKPMIPDEKIDVMTNSVNLARLQNNPVKPDIQDIKNMYLQIRQ